MTNRNKKDKSQTGPWIITITLLAALSVSYYQWNRHTTQTQFYSEIMKNYTPPVNANVEKGSINNEFNKAIAEFDQKNYEASSVLFKKIKPKSDTIHWYLGHIALINGNVYESRNHSRKIEDSALQGELLRYVDQIISK